MHSGGSSTAPLPFALPDVGEDEIAAVADVLRSGWLTTGSRCRTFEAAFAAAVGAAHAVALNSCTAALHLALEALGIRQGDLVVTTPYTFAACAEVIRYFDAVPVFVDIEETTFSIDTDALETVVNKLASGDPGPLPPAARASAVPTAPKAILPVHIGGQACDLTTIYATAQRHGAAVVEDAAHAFPSSFDGRPIGSAVDPSVRSATCFSFYATKTITTGEGGMLVTDDEDIAERARMMSLHGLSRDAWNRYAGGSWKYDIVAPGYKYNLTDVAAAMGLAQLKRADTMRDRRREIADWYDARFSGHPALQVPARVERSASAWHLYMLRLHLDALDIDRAAFINEMTELAVSTSVHFIPLHLHSYYQSTYGYVDDDFPVATREYLREVSLPIYSAMSDDDVERVCDAVLTIAHRHTTPE